MKRTNDELKKSILRDCRKSDILPTIIGTISGLLNGLISIYTANVLGGFADAVFKQNISLGVNNFIKLLFCIGLDTLMIPAMQLLEDTYMFRNALKHDRIVLNRFHMKSYMEAMRIDEGEAQMRLDDDPNNLRIIWCVLMETYLTLPVTVVYLMYFTCRISILYTIIVLAVFALQLTVPIAVRKLNARYDMQKRDYEMKVSAYETEITTKPHVIRLYGLKDALVKRLDRLYKTYYHDVFTKSVKCTSLASSVSSVLNNLCMTIILLSGALMASSGHITPGDIVAMIAYFSVFDSIYQSISYIIKNRPLLKNAIERMRVLYKDRESEEGIDAGRIKNISANGLSFTYGQTDVLHDVNFAVNIGSKSAICGANGSGKSTLIKLIMGLNSGYCGSLKINGTELSQIDVRSIRKQISYAAQNPYLFNGRVVDNIHLGNLGAEDKDVEELMCKMGIDYLSEREVLSIRNDLSGGEKQKISIARALLKNTPILVLDEPGNNLDSDSVNWLSDFIKNSTKTILFISHDESLSRIADERIYL